MSKADPKKNFPEGESISTENISAIVPVSGTGGVLPFGHSSLSPDQNLEEEARKAYEQVKPQFYTVCKMLADS